jgi:serine/threonine protein kinase
MELKIKLTSRKRTKIKTRKNNKKIIMNTSKKSGQVIDNKYILYHTLGEGTYGVVYYATDMDGNQKYAIKKIKIEENDEGIPSTTLREISVLKSLDHPNIIKLIEVIYNSV